MFLRFAYLALYPKVLTQRTMLYHRSLRSDRHLGRSFEGENREIEQKRSPVRAHERRTTKKQLLEGAENESGLRFDDSVPLEIIEIPNPDIEGLPEDKYVIITEEVTHRLAQRPGAYYVMRYVRKAAKLKETGEITTSPAPPSVFERSYADVTFLVGLIIDKFLYHLPAKRLRHHIEPKHAYGACPPGGGFARRHC